MIWLYRLAYLPLFLLLFPYYLRRMIRRGGYAHDWKHRFASYPPLPRRQPHHTRIWIQAVSVGEIEACRALIESLQQDGCWEIVLSTTTSTGYEMARRRYGQTCHVIQFPLDFWPISQRAWEHIQPDVAALMESELWPEHLHQARRHHVPIILINGRLSDRSFQRYYRLRALASQLFRPLAQVLAVSAEDAKRFARLGIPSRNIQVTGNLKCDLDPHPILDAAAIDQLRQDCGMPPRGEGLVLFGASTWAGEEEVLVQTWQQARQLGLPCHLFIVPRHAERREQIMRRFKAHGVENFALRSQQTEPPAAVDVYLADTTGELRRLIQLADVVFIGKSLPPFHSEGQTPVEAATYGKAMVFGSMKNFRSLSASLIENQAAVRIHNRRELEEALLKLLQDPERRQSMGQRAQKWAKENRGSLKKTTDALRYWCKRKPAVTRV